MKEASDSKQYDRWSNLEGLFRARAKKHERAGLYDMLLIVFTLVVGIVVFSGSEKIYDFVLKTPAQRQADVELRNAGAKVLSAISALADPASEVIRSLPAELRPLLDEYLRRLSDRDTSVERDDTIVWTQRSLPTPSEQPAGSEAPHQDEESMSSPANNQGVLALPSAPDLPASIPQEPKARPDTTLSVKETADTAQVYQLLIAQQEKNLELIAQLEEERSMRFSGPDEEYIQRMKTDAEIEIAIYRANIDRDIAEAQSNALSETAYEETRRAEEWNSLVLGALTRIGSVVLIIWLIKIFVAKRQRAVKLSAFYLGLADAIAMSDKSDPKSFIEVLPHVLPPEEDQGPALDTPVGSLANSLNAVAQKS